MFRLKSASSWVFSYGSTTNLYAVETEHTQLNVSYPSKN